MKKGFSLVELSIVLVIIGLVIGGVLVGQSMVQTTRIQMVTKDLHQYEIAVANFVQARKFYPGDDPKAQPAGNGDGIINNYDDAGGVSTGMGSVPVTDPNQLGGGFETDFWQGFPGPIKQPVASCQNNYSGDEGTQAFVQMSSLKMLPAEYSAYSPTVCGGSQDDNYFNTGEQNAPYNTIDKDAISVTGAGPKIPFKAMKDATRGNYYLYFLASAKDVKGLESKLGSATHYDNAVGLVNFNSTGLCNNVDGTAYDCTDKTVQTQGRLGYFISGGDM